MEHFLDDRNNDPEPVFTVFWSTAVGFVSYRGLLFPHPVALSSLISLHLLGLLKFSLGLNEPTISCLIFCFRPLTQKARGWTRLGCWPLVQGRAHELRHSAHGVKCATCPSLTSPRRAVMPRANTSGQAGAHRCLLVHLKQQRGVDPIRSLVSQKQVFSYLTVSH